MTKDYPLDKLQGWTLSAAFKREGYRNLLLKSLDEEDFTSHERRIFQAMVEATGAGKLDLLKLDASLTADTRKRFMEIEADYMGKTDELTFREWLKAIRDASEGRIVTAALANAGTQIAAGDRVDAVLSDLLTEVSRARERSKGETMIPLKVGVARVREMMVKAQSGELDIETVPTGFGDLDRLTGGMVRKHITVLGGRPSQGKTNLALQIAHKVALWGKGQKRDAAIVIFSAEMTIERLIMRLASSISGVSSRAWRDKTATPEQIDAYKAALTQLEDIGDRVVVDETPDPTTKQMLARVAVEAMSHKDGIDLVIFDYIELAGDGGGKDGNEDVRIGRVMRGLKVIAKRYNCPALALSQLNRKVDERPSRLPELADLRSSGNVENLAQQVVFIMRPAAYGKQNRETGKWSYPTDPLTAMAKEHGDDCVIIDVPKNRDGATGRVVMHFDGPITRIYETSDKGATKPANPSISEAERARADRQAANRAEWSDPLAKGAA